MAAIQYLTSELYLLSQCMLSLECRHLWERNTSTSSFDALLRFSFQILLPFPNSHCQDYLRNFFLLFITIGLTNRITLYIHISSSPLIPFMNKDFLIFTSDGVKKLYILSFLCVLLVYICMKRSIISSFPIFKI